MILSLITRKIDVHHVRNMIYMRNMYFNKFHLDLIKMKPVDSVRSDKDLTMGDSPARNTWCATEPPTRYVTPLLKTWQIHSTHLS